MSKGSSGLFDLTHGEIKSIASNLPANPNDLLKSGWKEITHPSLYKANGSREFIDEFSNLVIRFDRAVKGSPGFKGKDHYHIKNPNYTNKKKDYYFDKNGNPVGKSSAASHILPKGKSHN